MRLYFYFAYPANLWFEAKLDNIEDDELRDYKALAKAYLDFTEGNAEVAGTTFGEECGNAKTFLRYLITW